ncbi:hypothetical protein K435DRAFT_832596 [Dendrothele bispora CBS 962.96]|uniref:Heterokaryon incompatibility domain-containing protein n=1 Tax=Dendrothele bispora (strain CBS 962.96) TaxID=1314807 RepID=A0A4S8KLJ3_DENBC|nr:hypothetical protein K435DRAFT_832596 [Dendrothele bispora CBS 962.96]
MFSIDTCPRTFIDTHTIKPFKFMETETVPPYAILSHRWINGEEVVYEELIHDLPTISKKSGYRKIEAACRQAYEDGYDCLWIDTCCIKQEEEAFQGNIPNMYGFYQNSDICYVYLSDVSFKKDFRNSQWFKRGWTLQELVAPRTVVFYDSHWQYIGDKDGLREEIYLKTTIPPDVLSGKQSIQDIAIIDRMTWVLERETTRKQDLAYCLQGLLGVRVELDYKEGDWLTDIRAEMPFTD